MRMNVIVVDVDVVVVRGHDHGHAIATRIRSTLATILMRWLGYERIQQFFFCLNVYHITQYISSVRARRQTANGCCSRQGGLPNERTETKQKKKIERSSSSVVSQFHCRFVSSLLVAIGANIHHLIFSFNPMIYLYAQQMKNDARHKTLNFDRICVSKFKEMDMNNNYHCRWCRIFGWEYNICSTSYTT